MFSESNVHQVKHLLDMFSHVLGEVGSTSYEEIK